MSDKKRISRCAKVFGGNYHMLDVEFRLLLGGAIAKHSVNIGDNTAGISDDAIEHILGLPRKRYGAEYIIQYVEMITRIQLTDLGHGYSYQIM
jgi:hypothetical protein